MEEVMKPRNNEGKGTGRDGMRVVVGGRHELCGEYRGRRGGRDRQSKPPPPAAATRYLEMRIALYVGSSEFVISSKNPLLNSCEPLQSQDSKQYAFIILPRVFQTTVHMKSRERLEKILAVCGKSFTVNWR
ncbi:hypothetical protein V1477_014547 [Vespula maculifrons]|uniref:Uncharacterized protein n=2 Tax=Vespula TaxID=7451 RepID=A0A834U4K3_VESPE|nr:hypothetical protein H0235_012541 [Vespula pensylvanica]